MSASGFSTLEKKTSLVAFVRMNYEMAVHAFTENHDDYGEHCMQQTIDRSKQLVTQQDAEGSFASRWEAIDLIKQHMKDVPPHQKMQAHLPAFEAEIQKLRNQTLRGAK